MNEHLPYVPKPGDFSESDLDWVRRLCQRLPGYLAQAQVGWADDADPERSVIEISGYYITKVPAEYPVSSILGIKYEQGYEYVVSVEVTSYSWHTGYDWDMKNLGAFRTLWEAVREIYLQDHKAAFDAACEALHFEEYDYEEYDYEEYDHE